MSDDRKSGLQRGLTRVVSPARAAAMEAESRTWMIRCTYCGFEQSVWAVGGVKYKAVGTSRQLRRCPNCGRLSWNILYRQTGLPNSGPATMPLADSRQRALRWVLGLGGLAAIIVAFVVGLILLLTAILQPVVNSGDAFMTALQSSDYAQAYALCTPALQQQLESVSGLTKIVQGYQPARWSWTSRSVRNGAGLLDGSMTYADGKAGTVHLVLDQVGGKWQIDSFRMNPT